MTDLHEALAADTAHPMTAYALAQEGLSVVDTLGDHLDTDTQVATTYSLIDEIEALGAEEPNSAFAHRVLRNDL